VSSIAGDSRTDHHPTTIEQTREGQPSAEKQRVLNNFKRWPDNILTQSYNAIAVLLNAAQILDEQGLLEASELWKQSYEHNPAAYSSAEALWASTVEHLYDDLPGFERPKHGTYRFNRETAMESLTKSVPDPYVLSRPVSTTGRVGRGSSLGVVHLVFQCRNAASAEDIK
jgi:hypothetical protein